MKRSFLMRMKGAALTAALAAASSSVAYAHDSSLNPFTGESYAAFNGANLPGTGNPSFGAAPSAWRQANPGGLSERELQSDASSGDAWQIASPTEAPAPAVASFAQSHPHGLTERELQALSSDSDAWRLAPAPGSSG
ncbi:MAG TPA: hypothetical protein VMN79_10735 [Casimicrobiaceae bacterium]|nr:hypothetical protein [Casimicrobiaceae bacterium]